MKKILSFFVLYVGVIFNGYAQQILTLDSCRSLALANNKELRIAQEKINAAHYQKKAAFTNFLPKVDLTGAYIRTQKEVSLLSDEQKQTIGNIGTTTGNQLQQIMQSADFQAAMKQIAASNPGLAAGLQGLLPGMVSGLTTGLNGVGQSFVDALHTDTRNLTVGAVTLTQPLFMGGKIIAYNKITKYAERLAESQHATGMEDLILNTDQAYWQVISLVNKKKLAEGFLQFMENLTLPNTYVESNVSTALANREELKSLELASQIYRQKVNVARSEFLPSVAITANYLVTNPSLVNGFENKFRGMWAAGVVVSVPILHWGEGIYKVKAAKAEANIARYRLEDVKEKVELQVTQSSYKVNEATKKLAMAEKNMEKAEENLRYANLGFKEGVIPTSNVLEAQTAWLSAQSGKIDAQIDLKMSELYLNKSMGTLK